jgi:hypothetical protein
VIKKLQISFLSPRLAPGACGSVPGQTLEDLVVGGVPRIEMFPAGRRYRPGQGFFVRLVSTLHGLISPAQNIDGWRMHLAMHNNVARVRTATAHEEANVL